MPKRDELSRPPLHGLLVRTAGAGKVSGQRNDFFYTAVCVVPEPDAERKILLAALTKSQVWERNKNSSGIQNLSLIHI